MSEPLKIVSFESRRSEDMTRLLERYGFAPIAAPSMREVPLDDQVEALAFGDVLLAGQCDFLVLLTGVGFRAMLDVLDQDYIRTAYAKGLSKRQVIWKHGLRNALNPVITAITGWFAELLAGAFFVEYIFGWQGIGNVTVDALEKLDYPVVMGAVLVAATFFILVNILADILYGVVDPRVRVE